MKRRCLKMTNEIKAVEERIELVDMVHGAFNIKMKGNWDVESDIEGFSVMRAESVVGEFVVTGTTRGEYKGKEDRFIVGTDFYNRGLSLPVSRILEVQKLDTDEQTKLKSFHQALHIFDEEDKYYKVLLEKIDELESKGVKEYIPARKDS